jgi:hypothetical protein
MNKKLFLSLTAGVVALFSACSGDVVDLDSSARQPVQTKANLTVTVQDAIKGEAQDDADVSLNSGESQKTNATGVTVFKEVTAGYHWLRIKKTGFAEMFQPVEVTPESDKNIYIARESVASVQLYPLTSGLTGYLYFTDKDGIDRPAVGVKVYIQISDDLQNLDYKYLVEKSYPEITKDDGKYEFKTLPAVGRYFSIWTEGKTLEGIPFGTKNIDRRGVILEGGKSKVISYDLNYDRLTSTQNTAIFVIKDYNKIVDYNDPTETGILTFEFNDKIDPAYFTGNTVTISDEVADFKWDESYTKLTITPVGKWRNSSFNVNVNNLKSMSGKSLSGLYSINVIYKDLSGDIIVPNLLTKRADIDCDGRSIQLRWKKIPGVDDGFYTVYRNSEGASQNGYETVSANFVYSADSVTATVGTGTIGYRTISFLVQGRNGTSKTILDEEKAITIRDEKKPEINNPGVNVADTSVLLNIYSLLSNPAALTDQNVISIYFSEPMDTTVALKGDWKIEGTETGDGPIKTKIKAIKLKWTNGVCSETATQAPSDRYLTLCIDTQEGNAISASATNVRYRIGDKEDSKNNFLKDWQGNKLEQKIEKVPVYTSGTITSYRTAIWNNYVDIRLKW